MNTDVKENLRVRPEPLLDALRSAGAQIRSEGKAFKCPFHDDKSPSASVKASAGGVWRFHCYAGSCPFAARFSKGGDVFDVTEFSTNRTAADQLSDLRRDMIGTQQRETVNPEPTPAEPPKTFPSIAAMEGNIQNRTATYVYSNPDSGKPELIVFRIDPPQDKKFFRQATPYGDGFIFKGLAGKTLPIYNRGRIRRAKEIIFVEGEKCVHALHDAGFVATTGPGGCAPGNADRYDLTPLAGKKLWLWPDNDADRDDGTNGGKDHMRAIADAAKRLPNPPQMFWIDPLKLNLAEKDDVVDFLARYDGIDSQQAAVNEAMCSATALGAAGELDLHLRRIVSGEIRNISWPWPMLTELTCALLPGSVTVLFGEPGVGKTFIILQCLMHWIDNDVPSAVMFIEKDRCFHSHRLLALLEGDGNLLNYKWIKENPDDVGECMARHSDRIDQIGRHIYSSPREQLSMDGVVTWMRKQAEAGTRVAIIDPITAIATGKQRWDEDRDFMFAIQQIATDHMMSVIVVTHPKKGDRQGKPGTEMTAGGAAYDRFCDVEIFMERLAKPKKVQVMSWLAGNRIVNSGSFDRFIRVNKARNARGKGLSIAYTFGGNCFESTGDRLKYAEQGVVLKEVPESAPLIQPPTFEN